MEYLEGSLEAWRNLAAMYYTGDGIPKSEETAKEIMRVMFNNDKKDD
jgi:TPR repeat protein